MPVTVTMHAYSTCAVAIDFTVFRCYLAGYSVEETVEHLMSTREEWEQLPSPAPSAASHSPISTPVGVGAPTSRRGKADPAKPLSDLSSLKREDQRQDTEEAPLALLPPEETLTVAALVENASMMAALNGPNLPKGEEEALPHGDNRDDVSLVAGDRRLPREAARAPTVVPHAEDRERPRASPAKDRSTKAKKKDRRGKDRHHHSGSGVHNHNSTSYSGGGGGGGGGAFDEQQQRDRKRKRALWEKGLPSSGLREPKSRSFFLNEDYLAFQRRLQQVEGGPSSGAPLRSSILFLETAEQYRLYELFIQENFLRTPYAFLTCHYLPIAVSDRLKLVELYYEVDTAVFRYFFGDKMQKFEPIDRWHFSRAAGTGGGLHEAGAAVAGLGGVVGGGGGGGGGGHGNNGAAPAAVNGMLFGWALRGSHNEEAIAHLLHINTSSLKRQWDNIKNVCTTMVNLYLGKSDMFVPRGISLLEAIQQCYGIRGELAASYATTVFGYHHKLTTRLLDVLHEFSGYSTLCNIVAAQWCDQTLFLLDERFVDRCRRIGKLLDESRVLAELHQLMFGEALRPRWQVQLDEVQRAITTNSGTGEKSTAAAAAAAAALTNMIASPASQHGNVPCSPLSASAPAGGAVREAWPRRNSPRPPRPQSPLSSTVPAAHTASFAGLLFGGGGPSYADTSHSPTAAVAAAAAAAAAVGPTAGGGGNGVVGGAAAVTQHSPLCANKQFSRRFMYEFAYMLRHLARVALQIGVNTSINDALDIFYVRIYTYLEGMSSRSAPAMANMVMTSAAAAAAAAASPANVRETFPAAGANGSGGPASLTTAKSHTYLSSSALSDGTGALPGAVGSSDASHRTTVPAKTLVKASSVPTFVTEAPSAAAAAASSLSLSLTMHGGMESKEVAHDGPSPLGDDLPLATPTRLDGTSTDASMPSTKPITSIVNTSMSHPVTSLLPLTSLVAQQQVIGGGPNGSSGSGGVGGFEEHGAASFSGEGNVSGTFTPSPATPPPHGGSSGNGMAARTSVDRNTSMPLDASSIAGSTAGMPLPRTDSATVPPPGGRAAAAFDPALFGDVMLKALDKRYLRELNMFLSALPRVWRQAHTLTAEDHAACDDAFLDFIIALKAITQVIMAAEDFH